MNDTKKPAKSTAKTASGSALSEYELAALKETVKERKTEARRGPRAAKADGESDVLAKIAEMSKSDRDMAERIHAFIKASVPELSPKTWYGMPAYANKDDKVICFFTPADKFKERYASFGFQPTAKLDEGSMWPTSWALTKLTPADEKKIGALVKKAVR